MPDIAITETTKEIKKGKTVSQAHVRKAGGDEVEIKVAEEGTLISSVKKMTKRAKTKYPSRLSGVATAVQRVEPSASDKTRRPAVGKN
jgi:hypothetical protein